ncbi:MAG: hypothetical protein HFJ52_04010 [Clostridia bacterium]|jgi:hypothetical protein|nr:hypothetical protein [Clostridia bacterium]
MKRAEIIVLDLKVKNYETLRLKQLDTTELTFKILDNGLGINLSSLSADIIFKKPNELIVIQECSIDEENSTITVTLLDDCLRIARRSGNRDSTQTKFRDSVYILHECIYRKNVKRKYDIR